MKETLRGTRTWPLKIHRDDSHLYIYKYKQPEEAKITIRTGYSFQSNPLSDTGTTTLCQGEEMFQFI